MTPGKIVIIDCDHESVDIELQYAKERDFDLAVAQCRTEDDVIAAARDAEAIVVQYAPITARVLDALPQLRAVGRYGVGVDTVDVDAATARGVAVCNVPDYGTEDVSDHAIALALSLARGIVQLNHGMRRGSHELLPVKPLHRSGTRTFGVIGLGLIGSATARKAAGVGYTVIGFDPTRESGTTTDDGVRVATFEEVLRDADIISLHVPLNNATHHMIDAGALAQMKSTSVLINTCRGGVVDTDALVAALRAGNIKGAGLDVFEEEPLPADHPLASMDNVALTPHAAWYSEESYAELKRRTVENVADVVTGIRPRNVLNPQVLGFPSSTERPVGA